MAKTNQDYYNEIDTVLTEYENYKIWHTKSAATILMVTALFLCISGFSNANYLIINHE